MHRKRYWLLPFTGKNVNFHNHASQKLAPLLAFHQKEADEFGGDDLGGASEEGWGEYWEGLGGYGSGSGGGAAKMKRLDTMVFCYAFLGTKNILGAIGAPLSLILSLLIWIIGPCIIQSSSDYCKNGIELPTPN